MNGDANDEIAAIALDGATDVYVTGQTNSVSFNGSAKPGANYDGFIVKLDNAAMGASVWTEFLSGAGNDYPKDIAVDASGYSFVTGSTSSDNFDGETYTAVGNDAFTTMRDPSGNRVWTGVLVYDANDFGTGVVLDNWNYVYVSGYTTSVVFDGEDTSMPADEAFIYKYTPGGAKH